jgi:lipopolysaccharide transport system permease protein
MHPLLRSLWHYRSFIWGSVQREFQSNYRNSLLGAAWTVINPLAMILVYTVIFSQVMKTRLPGTDSSLAYSIYLCAGVLTWGLFVEIVGRGQNIFIENANILKKINFPRLTLPVILVLNACVNFAIIFALFLFFLLFSGHWPGWTLLNMLPLLGIQLLLSVGLAMVLGVANVFFRDVGQFIGIFLQFWFWLTPIVYPVAILPEQVRSLMILNPMFPLIHAYQSVLAGQGVADWSALLVPLVTGLVLCAGAWRMFRSHAGEMVDEL